MYLFMLWTFNIANNLVKNMKKIKKNIGQQKNGVSQQHFEADKDLVAKSGASFCVKVSQL